jgi:exosome complex RNA-binding protein Csl4
LEEKNVSEETTLNDENANLRDERDQLRDNREQLVVDRIDELQTNLNEIKSSDVLRQVQDLQEQLLLVEMENVNEMITPNDENEKGVGTVQLRDEREQLVDHIDKLQADLNEIKSSDMILQLQDLQEELQLLEGMKTKIYEMKD